MSLFFGLLLAASVPCTDSIPYNLSQPSKVMLLEDERLREISGLGATDQRDIYAAIADEKGEIYLIDASQNGKITQVIAFKDKGDFEGVEFVGKCLYANKSDGTIFEIGCWQNGKPQIESYRTGLGKASDVEGMCYDPSRKCLLLSSKGDPKNDSLRYIWAFDLVEKDLLEVPLFSIDPNEVNRVVPYSPTEKQDFFSPSGIAIHPFTKEIYVISSALKRIIVLDGKTGKIKMGAHLDKKHLPQPEGISFDVEGNLYISSEGKDAEGRLLRFDRKQ